jgi:hypothetical protein
MTDTVLVPCSSCARHARADSQCPFCGSRVDAAAAPAELPTRLHRAAMIGLGAAAIFTASCSPPYGVTPVDVSWRVDAVANDQQSAPDVAPAPSDASDDAATD